MYPIHIEQNVFAAHYEAPNVTMPDPDEENDPSKDDPTQIPDNQTGPRA